jgi:hypothetical protein
MGDIFVNSLISNKRITFQDAARALDLRTVFLKRLDLKVDP